MYLLELLTYILLIIWIYFIWIRRKYYVLYSKIPGPLGLPFLGMAHKLRKTEDILSAFGEAIENHGSLFLSWLGPVPIVIVSDPQLVEDILTSTHCVDKPIMYDAVTDGLGEGLFSIKNPQWSTRRKFLNPAFNNKVLQSFMPIFNMEINQLLKTLDSHASLKKEIELMEIVQSFTLNLALKTTMGNSISSNTKLQPDNILKSYGCILKMMSDMTFSPWLKYRVIRILLGREGAYSCAKRNITNFLTNTLKEKLSDSGLEEKSEINIFIKIVTDLWKRGDLTWQNVMDESNVIVSGAFETTSNTLVYTLMLLAMHPKYQERAFEEIVSIFPDGGEFDVTYVNIQDMVYMDLILNEVMRLLAPVPIVARHVTQDVKLSNGIVLPKDIDIAIDIFHMHRSTKLWGLDANVFNPERFFKSNMEGKHPYAFIPFTKGIRNCIGWRYALMSLKTTLAKVLRNYYFTTTFSYDDLHFVEDITIKLKKIPLFELHKRK